MVWKFYFGSPEGRGDDKGEDDDDDDDNDEDDDEGEMLRHEFCNCVKHHHFRRRTNQKSAAKFDLGQRP